MNPRPLDFEVCALPLTYQISHPEHPAAVERDNFERRLGRRVADDEQDVRTTRVQDLEEAAVVGDQHQAERISKLEKHGT